jgi:hypothetical protein
MRPASSAPSVGLVVERAEIDVVRSYPPPGSSNGSPPPAPAMCVPQPSRCAGPDRVRTATLEPQALRVVRRRCALNPAAAAVTP